MILRLSIKKQSDPSFSRDLDINSFPASIGREESSDILLPDPFKIISRKHAVIVDTEGILQIIDLASANFTYLNDQRMEPNEENALKSGDRIRIGEYELAVEMLMLKPLSKNDFEDTEKTVYFNNPFNEEISAIAESLLRISEKYEAETSGSKADTLRFSLKNILDKIDKTETNRILGEYFSEKFGDTGLWHAEIDKSQPFKKEIKKKETPKKYAALAKQPYMGNFSEISGEHSFNSHFANIINTLLDTVSRMMQGLLHFKEEFFGATIYYTMPSGSLKELKEYLFNPSVSLEEEQKRESLLKEEAQKLLAHQIGLLEGYKLSAMEGSRTMLQSLDPEYIEKEVRNYSGSSWMTKGSLRKKVLAEIDEQFKKYISDPNHMEKKFFRPLFIKGYQKRIPDKPQDEF